MIKILAVLVGSLAFGFALAFPVIDWPIKVGYLGCAVMIATAWAARVYWDRRQARVGDDPGAPEREVWHYLATTAVVGGHLIGIIVQPGFDMHSAVGHAHAVNNWTLIGGAIASYFVLHNSEAKRDERDKAISAQAISVGYGTLIFLLIVLLLNLGFAPKRILEPFSHQLLAHVLIAALALASLAQSVAQLVGYRRDALSSSEPLH